MTAYRRFRRGCRGVSLIGLVALVTVCAPATATCAAAAQTPAAPAASATAGEQAPQAALHLLTEPVNDFANVIAPGNAAELSRMIRALQATTGDVIIVTTVPTFAPYGSIQEYAVKLFENQGRGIGEKGKDNGLLVLLAANDRKVWIEVGYGLEGFITDGYAGETTRQAMLPFFREGRYGDGLQAGVARLIGRIAEGRGVSVENLRAPTPPRSANTRTRPIPIGVYIFLAILAINVLRATFSDGGSRRGGRRGGGWSGWSGGVGPFGGGSSGGWGGGFGGGGGGGGFGGFGGGRSGGGGGGGSW